MSVVKELFYSSQKLVKLLQHSLPKDDDAREEFIGKIEQILKERQALIHKLTNLQSNEAEIKLGQEIVKMSKLIEEKLASVQQQIKKDINVFNDKKVKNKKYDNPYDGPTLEGAFIDKRGI